MKIGFIGAGKVACSLGKIFEAGEIPLTGYYSRQSESALWAAKFTNSTYYDNLEDIVLDSDAIFLTVPDGAISLVFDQIKNYDIKGKMICHCSGAMTSDEAFSDIGKYGAYGFSIHPLYPVSSKDEAYTGLKDAFFCIESSNSDADVWIKLFMGLGIKARTIAPEAKKKYHCACSVASNLVCALLEDSIELLNDIGFGEKEAIEALSPLILSNVNRCLEVGPVEALTGPIERADLGTVREHLAVLDDDGKKAVYKSASLKLCQMAKKRHPDRDYKQIEDYLED